MKHYVGTIVMVCLLLVGCGDKEAEQKPEAASAPEPATQATILSAVPGEACGFAAAKSPQGIVDRFKTLLPALQELEEPLEDALAPIRKVLGDVDLSGPAALVVLDLGDFDEEKPPIAFLVSAADAEAVVASHRETGAEGETDLPARVVKVHAEELETDLYMAAKGEFVIVAMNAESAEEMLKSESSLAVLPEVRQAYGQGKIVAQVDMEQVRTFMMNLHSQKMQARKAAAEDEGSTLDDPGLFVMANEISLLFLDIAEMHETLVYIIDVNEQGIYATEKTIPKEGSLISEFNKAHAGQDDPSYEGLPAGSFIAAGAVKMSAQELDPIVDMMLAKVEKYPSLQEKLDEEDIQRIVADVRNFYRQFSGMAFTAGMGNMGTGMLSMVCRFNVADAGAFKEHIKQLCQSELALKLTEHTGIELGYDEAIESYDGVDIDAVRIGLVEFDEAEGVSDAVEIGQQVMKVMPMVIGPDLSIRVLAPNDKQVLVVVSGGYVRAERVINVINGRGSSLANFAKIKQAVQGMPSNRLTEVHYDFGQLLGLMKQFAPGEFNKMFEGSGGFDVASVPLISGCGAVEGTVYREDLIVPADFVRILTGIFIPAVTKARGEANAAVCATNLKGLDTAMYLYANMNEDRYPEPARWKEILIEEDLAPARQFICPSLDGDPETENDYVFVPWAGPDEADGNVLVLFEKQANHNGRRNVVTGNHGVSRVTEAEFQNMLARTIEGLKAREIDFDWQE